MPKISDAKLAARRQQILDAAAACFARDGFHRASMQDVVRECGVSAGLVYRYFASKDEMIAAIVAQWHDQRRARLGPEPSTEDYLALLRSVGEPRARDELRLGVQVWAEAIRSARIRDVVLSGVDGPRALAARALADGPLAARTLANGALGDRGADPDAVARILIAIYQGLVLQTAWDETVDNEAFVRALTAMLGAPAD
jgi:AcrR family transcriptional regulator